MKKSLLLVLAIVTLAGAQAQMNKVNWTFSSKKIAAGTYEVHLKADIASNWHMYAQNVGVDGPIPTTFTFTKNPLLTVDGKVKEVGKVVKKNEEVWGGVVNYYENNVDFVAIVKVKGKAKTNLAGKLEYMVCDDKQCLPPTEVPFSVNIGG
jgi:DsbC/DsbD-like thiol-disulfide interchange protein